jgi:hypothetical protein
MLATGRNYGVDKKVGWKRTAVPQKNDDVEIGAQVIIQEDENDSLDDFATSSIDEFNMRDLLSEAPDYTSFDISRKCECLF